MQNCLNDFGFKRLLKPLHFFSFFAFFLCLVTLGEAQTTSDPPTIWLEMVDREPIEEGVSQVFFKVMLSEVSTKELLIRFKYEGDAQLGADFTAPISQRIALGQEEVLLTIDLKESIVQREQLTISILDAPNANIDKQKLNFRIEKTSLPITTQEVALRGPRSLNLGANSSQGGGGAIGNTVVGDSAGHALTTADYNTFLGARAGRSARDSGDPENTNLGYGAARKSTDIGIFAIGYRAGGKHGIGDDATYIGTEAGKNSSNSNNTDNTYIGARAGLNSDFGPRAGRITNSGSAYDNTFIGSEAGLSNRGGFENTFLGVSSGYNNDGGYRNTFVGVRSGYNNTFGYRNTAAGVESFFANTTGHHNTAIGDSTGINNTTGKWNLFVGAAAGANNRRAIFNTFVGAFAGYNNNANNSALADRNTYFGFRTGYSNIQGRNNTGMGAFSDFKDGPAGNLTNRNHCTFFGSFQTIGNDDVELFGHRAYNTGQYAMAFGQLSNVQATGAIAMGYSGVIASGADYAIGWGYQNNIAASNAIGIGKDIDVDNVNAIAIGPDAVNQGDQSILIGAQSTNTSANAISIGFTGFSPNANEALIGNDITAAIGGIVNWTATSDARFKTDVQENVPGLDFIDALRPVTYQFDLDALSQYRGSTSSETLSDFILQKRQVRFSGFLAQEVEAAAQAINYSFSGIKRPQHEQDTYGLRYAAFVPSLVKAIQELDQKTQLEGAQMDQQNSELDQFKADIEKLKRRVEKLENTQNK